MNFVPCRPAPIRCSLHPRAVIACAGTAARHGRGRLGGAAQGSSRAADGMAAEGPRKARAYGTIVLDLERRRAIGLLPDRTGTTVADWLRQRPGTEVVVRDRSAEYARAAAAGASMDHLTPGRSATEQAALVRGRSRGRLRQDRHDAVAARFCVTATALAGAAGGFRSGAGRLFARVPHVLVATSQGPGATSLDTSRPWLIRVTSAYRSAYRSACRGHEKIQRTHPATAGSLGFYAAVPGPACVVSGAS